MFVHRTYNNNNNNYTVFNSAFGFCNAKNVLKYALKIGWGITVGKVYTNK